MATPVLRIVDLEKSYPGVRALGGVSFETLPGEVHALVGENGAGKSTLVKIIAGAIAPDSGSVVVDDRAVTMFAPRHARALGISVIHQERQIAPDLGVVENVLLGALPSRAGIVDWGQARRRVAETLGTLGADIDIDARVRDLSAAEWQLLEIARAMFERARVLLMDEPTSSLGGRDVARLFATIDRLRAAGVGIVYVSHHLEEVLRLADRISVLRDGRLVTTVRSTEVDPRSLGELIIGRPLPDRHVGSTDGAPIGSAPLLDLVEVTAGTTLGPVSLQVHPGEVVCVTGAVGSGRRELARIAAFVDRPDSGAATAFGRRIGSTSAAVRAGVVFLPDDRKRDALFLGQSVRFNVGIGRLVASPGRYRPGEHRQAALRALEDVQVPAWRLDHPIDQLSGGNQQKVLLGRWMGVGARLYVLDEPSAGVDVGARAEIYRLLRERVASGAGVLAFTSDFEEIRELADRVVVLRNGRIAGEIRGADASAEALLSMQLVGEGSAPDVFAAAS